MNYNKVILMGNLTRDVELRYIGNNTAVTDLGLAVNHSYRRQDGEQVDETTFVDCTVWGRQAETCNQYLAKGRGVLVEGRLKMDSWETPEGQKRTKLKVVADNVRFLPRSANSGGGGQGGGSQGGGGQRGGGRGEEVSDYGRSFGGGSGRPQQQQPQDEFGAEGTYHDDSVPF